MHTNKNERRPGGPENRFKDGPENRFKDRSGSRAKADFSMRDSSQNQLKRDSRENGSGSKSEVGHTHSSKDVSRDHLKITSSSDPSKVKVEHASKDVSRDHSISRDRHENKGREIKREKAQGEDDQSMDDGGEKKFTGRCRLFVGNISVEFSEEEFKKMFEDHGEVSEVYANPSRGFGFIRMDTRGNAEAAKKALDGAVRRGRMLRVRFAAHSAALKVKYLPTHVTNELLEKAFSQFGEVERAIVIGDDRGKSVGEGLVEFARKTGAQQAMNRINNGVFIMGSAPKPIVVEALEQRDEDDGVSEKFQPKNLNFREREREPGFAEPGSFEFEYGQKWKDLYNLERQRQEQVKREMEEAFMKQENDMEGAEQEYQTIVLRQDLMRRQEELRRLEEDMARRRGVNGRMSLEAGRKEEMRHTVGRDIDDDRRRQEMIMRQQQEEMRRRELEHRGMRSREEERELLMQGGHMREGMSQQHVQSMGQMGSQNQGQPQLRQSRFDQPPQQALFNQMGNQNPAMQGMQQGGMRGQSMTQQQQQAGQSGHAGAQGQAMERNRERQTQREEFYEPKRPRRY